jgi:myosin heavy subunit
MVQVDSIRDEDELEEVLEAMKAVQISEEQKAELFKIVAAVLWIGQVDFVEKGEETVALKDAEPCKIIAGTFELIRLFYRHEACSLCGVWRDERFCIFFPHL